MSTPVLPDDVTTALRDLDGGGGDPSMARSSRARADLERILATPRTADAPMPRKRKRRARPAILLPLAAAAALVPLTVLAVAPSPASATWTKVGTPIPLDSPAAQQCKRWSTVESDAMQPAIAETRGEQSLVLLADGAGGELLCTVTLRERQEPNGGTTSRIDTTERIPAPDGVIGVVESAGYEDPGFQNSWQGNGEHAVAGHAGTEVERIVIDTDQGPVDATIADGRFVAWWPWDGQGEVNPTITADLHLKDGTVIHDVEISED